MEQYDICIVCVPQDRAIAETLAASIRNYRIPGGIRTPNPELDYRKVYVDSSASRFNDSVRSLLDNSNNLIVVCSPATKNDSGIYSRIVYFRQIKHDEDVIAVIAEAEPADSFPELFIEKKTVSHILPDMTVVEREETIEPVASDLRGITASDRRHALHYETVRIVASVLGMHPDMLVQRHRRRRNRRIAAVAAVVSAVLIVASGIFVRLGLIARDEGVIAEKQTEQSIIASERLILELPEVFADDPQALAYIQEAVDQASSALEQIESGG